MSDNNMECWFEQIVIPAREKAIKDSNVLTHILPLHRLAKLNATATAKENFRFKASGAKQRVGQQIKGEYLER
jgi:hypothetical protein